MCLLDAALDARFLKSLGRSIRWEWNTASLPNVYDQKKKLSRLARGSFFTMGESTWTWLCQLFLPSPWSFLSSCLAGSSLFGCQLGCDLSGRANRYLLMAFVRVHLFPGQIDDTDKRGRVGRDRDSAASHHATLGKPSCQRRPT
jgi:hypothetical protein